MFERRIRETDPARALESIETVEDYPHDEPYPSRLVLGWSGGRPLHLVIAHNTVENELLVITVYKPIPYKWGPGFKRGKQ